MKVFQLIIGLDDFGFFVSVTKDRRAENGVVQERASSIALRHAEQSTEPPTHFYTNRSYQDPF